MQLSVLSALQDARREKKPAATVTRLSDGLEALIVDGVKQCGALALDDEIIQASTDAIRKDKACRLERSDGDLFINVFNPPLRMIIIGAVHIAQSLAPMARTGGFDVTLIDPRGAWATPERFPEFAVSQEWPEEAMTAMAPDSRTAVVALTHDPKIDEPALAIACRSKAFYIGALGSRKTHAARLSRLHGEVGLDKEETGRIHGPIGLDIGASSPAEIAVAILAQVVCTLRGPKRFSS